MAHQCFQNFDLIRGWYLIRSEKVELFHNVDANLSSLHNHHIFKSQFKTASEFDQVRQISFVKKGPTCLYRYVI